MTQNSALPEQRRRRLERVRRAARLVAPLCLAATVLVPLATAVGVWGMPESELARHLGLAERALPALAPGRRSLLVALGAVPALLFAIGLHQAWRTLRSFSHGRFFAREAVNGLRGLAAYTCAAASASIVATPLASVILTWALGPGQRQLAMGLDSSTLLQLLTAGLVWLMSGALAEAEALADENAQFV